MLAWRTLVSPSYHPSVHCRRRSQRAGGATAKKFSCPRGIIQLLRLSASTTAADSSGPAPPGLPSARLSRVHPAHTRHPSQVYTRRTGRLQWCRRGQRYAPHSSRGRKRPRELRSHPHATDDLPATPLVYTQIPCIANCEPSPAHPPPKRDASTRGQGA